MASNDDESYALPDVPSSDDEDEEEVRIACGACRIHKVAPPAVAPPEVVPPAVAVAAEAVAFPHISPVDSYSGSVPFLLILFPYL